MADFIVLELTSLLSILLEGASFHLTLKLFDADLIIFLNKVISSTEDSVAADAF